MAREYNRLTAASVKSIRKPGRYSDGGGLYLQVGPTGGKSWLFRYMRTGRAREMGLGPVNTIPLATQVVMRDGERREIVGARDLAADARRLILQGVDPIDQRDSERQAGQMAQGLSKTFQECAVAYLRGHRAGWSNSKHAGQWESTLSTYVYPVIGNIPVAQIDTPQVLKVLEPIWTEKSETASRVRGRIETILDWAKVRGYRDGQNPARWRGHLDHTLPRRSKVAKVEHHAAMPFHKVPKFMEALREQDGVAARALEFLILTAARTGEVIGATWREMDLEEGIWTVPAERMKAGKQHKVPLSARAIEILKGAEGMDERFVFPGRDAGRGLSNMALLATLDRMSVKDATVHGFRSSFRDWAAERTQAAREVVEMCLAHSIGDKVEAAYRRGDLFERRKELMLLWASYCEPMDGKVRHIRSRSMVANAD